MPDAVAPQLSATPYPGLRPFRADESDIFFGREEQTDRLLEKLERSHFLAVVGGSGCGKSSLVRAGMIAALETGFMVGSGSSWEIAEIRPGDRPMSRLAGALAETLGTGRAPWLEATLRRGPLGLQEALREASFALETNLLLLVDQFEEIFRFRQKSDSDEADAFVALLLASANQREYRVHVVITMRSDFLGDCALFAGLPEAINESQYLTPRLAREQARCAITGPARVFGAEVDTALVCRLLNDFGPEPDQLPLLQHTLMRMWQRGSAAAREGERVVLGLEAYERLGGLSKSLSDHADEVMQELTQEQQRIAECMFRRLTEQGVEKRDTRAPARLSEVAAIVAVSPEAVIPVVEAFRRSDRSFLTPPPEIELVPETLLDIGHESLIRQWHKLSEWVEAEGRAAAVYRRLKQTAQLWKAGEAALWGNPDLERALQWERRHSAASAWAVRYGTADEFGVAIQFLRASEEAWQEERRQEEEERERERRAEIDRQTRAEHEQRLEAEARTGRVFKRLTALLAIVALLALLFAGAAVLLRSRAIQAQEVATAYQAAAEKQSEQERQQRLLADERLKRITDGIALKQAVLSGDRDKIQRFLDSPLANHHIRFLTRRQDLGYQNSDGKQMFQFRISPDPGSIEGGLDKVAVITYRMNHPSFQNALLATGRDREFTGSYNGWGCLTRVVALIEYVDPERSPEIAAFDMCLSILE